MMGAEFHQGCLMGPDWQEPGCNFDAIKAENTIDYRCDDAKKKTCDFLVSLRSGRLEDFKNAGH
jgi:hypothetical protein